MSEMISLDDGQTVKFGQSSSHDLNFSHDNRWLYSIKMLILLDPWSGWRNPYINVLSCCGILPATHLGSLKVNPKADNSGSNHSKTSRNCTVTSKYGLQTSDTKS